MATITFDTDADTNANIAFLATRLPQATISDIIQKALHDAANAARQNDPQAEAERRARLRAEADALRNDPVDRAAVKALQAELDGYRCW